MTASLTPAALVYTPYSPRAVAEASGATDADAFLGGGDTVLPPGAWLVIDFGQELVGVLDLDADVGGTGTRLEVVSGEDLEEALMAEDPFPPDHPYHQPRDHHDLDAGPQTVRQPGRRAFRFAKLVVHGPGTLVLRGAVMTLEHAPVDERGAFACSDELLTAAWEISRRTTRLCMQAFYEDGVKRDGMLWIGDYRVEFLCAHLLFADAALARRCLELFAQCRHPDGSLSAVALHAGGHMFPRIPWLADLDQPTGLADWVLDNYCVDFVSGLWEYVLHTGDATIVSELDPVLRGVSDYLAAVDTAAVVAGADFITDNQPDGLDWWGSRAAFGYQLAAGFRDAAELAGLLGDDALAARCRALAAERIAETIARFGDPRSGEARDDAPADATRSWHAHAAAFLAGALDADDLRRIFPDLQHDPAVRRPMAGFMEFPLLESWLEAGLVTEALDEMRSYYGQMLRSGATTTWELVDRREPGIDHIHPAGRSHCHGWSAGPAYHLPAHVLGVTPASAGYRTVDIRPALGDLEWAEGVVPTPQGDIRVAVRAPITGSVTLPEGVSGVLHVPGRPPHPLSSGTTEF
jgi:alpha-L-rhamnosidase